MKQEYPNVTFRGSRHFYWLLKVNHIKLNFLFWVEGRENNTAANVMKYLYIQVTEYFCWESNPGIYHELLTLHWAHMTGTRVDQARSVFKELTMFSFHIHYHCCQLFLSLPCLLFGGRWGRSTSSIFFCHLGKVCLHTIPLSINRTIFFVPPPQ